MEQSNLDLVKIFKALSNEQRLKLFELLYEWNDICEDDQACGCGEGVEGCFTRACGVLNLSRSTISHHFKELQLAGLIIVTRIGQSHSCKVNLEAIAAIQNFLK